MQNKYSFNSIIESRTSIIEILKQTDGNGNLYLITHNDIDGATAKLVATSCFPNINIITLPNAGKLEQYIDNINNSVPENFIITVDLEVDDKTARVINSNQNVLVFDHHEKSDVLSDKCSIVDPSLCASFLFYNYLLPEFPELQKFDKLMEYINDIDTSANRIPEAEYIGMLYDMEGEQCWLDRFKTDSSPILTEQEKLAINQVFRIKEQCINDTIDQLMLVQSDIHNNSYAEIELIDNMRETIQKIFDDNRDISYIVIHSPNSNKYADLPGFEMGFTRIVLREHDINELHKTAKLYTSEIRGGKLNTTYYPLDTDRYVEYLSKLEKKGLDKVASHKLKSNIDSYKNLRDF